MADVEILLVDQDEPHKSTDRVIGQYNLGAYCKHDKCGEFISLFANKVPPPKTIRISTGDVGAVLLCPFCQKYSLYRGGDFLQLMLNNENARRRA